MFKPLGVVLGVVLLAGCTAQVIPAKLQRSPSELVTETNYAIGAVREAYVGETIVKIRNYRMERVGTGYMISDQSFDVAVPGFADLHVEKGERYPGGGASRRREYCTTSSMFRPAAVRWASCLRRTQVK